MNEPTIGLALIAKDEEEQLPRLLASIEGAFDQVVLLDTGSGDKTVETFRKWAIEETKRNSLFSWHTPTFNWIDDFAAARTAADELLNTDWHVWADCDDVIINAEKLREIAATAQPDQNAFIFGYDYGRLPDGSCFCWLKRERLVRAGAGQWHGRVHEAQSFEGAAVDVPPEVCHWQHHPPAETDSSDRNIRILEEWVKDEPENPAVVAYLGTENLIRGRHEEALTWFERHRALNIPWGEERAQVARKTATALQALGRHQEAENLALEAMSMVPAWPDSYLTLAEVAYHRQRWAETIEWASTALSKGQPETVLIINPLDYTVQPRVLIAGALGAMNRVDEAIEVGAEVLQAAPAHEGIAEGMARWQALSLREATAKTWIGSAQQLIKHDEQLKALRLLEDTVPYFVDRHPMIVTLRSELRERVRPLLDPQAYAEHYRIGGSKPEDFIPDEFVDKVAGSLPRSKFLLDGVLEQIEEAA